MPPETTDRVNALLDHLEASITDVTAQLPLVAWEMVAYCRAFSAVLIVVGCLLITLGVRLIRKGDWRVWDRDGNPIIMAAGVAVSACLSVGPCMLIAGIDISLKSWLAPRYLVLEEVLKMVPQ